MIEPGWKVITLDGVPVGSVEEVQSDEELDIFHGLSVRVGIGRLPREVPSELVSAIEEGTITVAILSDEIGTLPSARLRNERYSWRGPGFRVTDKIETLLAEAAHRIERRSPDDVAAAMQAGALLIDVRSSENRARDGIVPGSLHLPRTVLEWRVAPDSEWRNPHVGGLDSELILICDHGDSTVSRRRGSSISGSRAPVT